MEKTYIGAIEALELATSWGLYDLPKKDREILRVCSMLENKPTKVLGKDSTGYYTGEINRMDIA